MLYYISILFEISISISIQRFWWMKFELYTSDSVLDIFDLWSLETSGIIKVIAIFAIAIAISNFRQQVSQREFMATTSINMTY